MCFYEKLYKLRKENNMTQEELAEQLNVSRQAVSKWEAGKSMPEVGKLREIAKLFAISIDYLLMDCEDKNDEMAGTDSQKAVFRQKRVSTRKIAGIIFSGLGCIGIFVLYIVYIITSVNSSEKITSFSGFLQYYKAEILILCCIILIVIGFLLFVKNFIIKIFQIICQQTRKFIVGTILLLSGIICTSLATSFLLNFTIGTGSYVIIDTLTQSPISQEIEIHASQPILPIIIIIISLTIMLAGIVIMTIELIKKRRSKRITKNNRSL